MFSILPKKIVLATSNEGKVKEFSDLTKSLNIECVPQKVFGVLDAKETGKTFIENAIIKARHATKFCHMPVIADDSGLVVDALNGEPGIYSARYAGHSKNFSDNIDKLLNKLKTIDDTSRFAKFYCVIVYMQNANDPTPIVCHGIWSGKITHQRKGKSGFGYDSIFYDETQKCTAAEMTSELKNKISHRAKAMAELKKNFFL